MKNLAKLSCLFLLAALPLSSCNGEGKIQLVYGQCYSDDVVAITHSELSGLVGDDMSFVVIVTPVSNCSCWSTFRNQVIKPYIEETNLLVYALNYNDFFTASTSLDTFGIDIRADRQTFAIFNLGNLQINLAYDSSNYIFKDYGTFKNFMDENVLLPKIIDIKNAQLEALYLQNEDFLIYFGRSLCGDCSYIDSHFLMEYVKKHPDMQYIYYFDGEEVREYDDDGNLTEQGEANWIAFKNKYGLSEATNPKYGYGEGYVPTFFYVSPNGTSTSSEVVQDGAVYFNDTIALNENNEYFVEITYYSNSRVSNLKYLGDLEALEGTILSSDEVLVSESGAIYWKQASAAVYHDKYLENFLNYYIPSLSSEILI